MAKLASCNVHMSCVMCCLKHYERDLVPWKALWFALVIACYLTF